MFQLLYVDAVAATVDAATAVAASADVIGHAIYVVVWVSIVAAAAATVAATVVVGTAVTICVAL